MPTLLSPPRRRKEREGFETPRCPPFPFSNLASRRQGDESRTPSVRCVPCSWTNSVISFAAIGSACRRPCRRWRSRCAAGASARRSWRRVRDEKPQVLDGFTRWEAATQVRGMTTLSVRLIDVDDRRAKAAIHGLNQTGRRPHELEEAWIVQALVREDGLSQAEVAELLGRHKSWVCRRLALLGEALPGGASGSGSRAVDPHRRAGDRPVAGRQPIGSSGCERGGRRSTAMSLPAWSGCSWSR